MNLPSTRESPLVRCVATLASGFLRSLARRVEIAADEEAARNLAHWFAEARSAPVLFFYWQRDVLALFVLGTSDSQVGALLRRVEYLCDDTFGGRVSAAVLRRLDGRSRLLSRSSAVARARDLQGTMRAKSALGIAVDGHGPYGTVGLEFARLARGSRGAVVPVAVGSSAEVSIWLRARMLLPMPRARLTIAVGDPADRSLAPEALRASLQAALDRVSEATRGKVAAPRAGVPQARAV